MVQRHFEGLIAYNKTARLSLNFENKKFAFSESMQQDGTQEVEGERCVVFAEVVFIGTFRRGKKANSARSGRSVAVQSLLCRPAAGAHIAFRVATDP